MPENSTEVNSAAVMRSGILPGEVRAQQSRSDSIRELGTAGVENYSGLFQQETVAALATPSKRYDVYTQMRSDPQIAALLAIISLPLEASTWSVVARDSDGRLGRQIADAVRGNLFGMREMLWDDFLRQALLMLAYGYELFETVYDIEPASRRLRWRKFAPRHQNTIQEWNTDPNGELISVTQRVSVKGKKAEITIPAEKLLRFTWRQEAGHFEGRPILRDAYRPWFYKDLLYKVQAIGAERMGIGFPLMRIPREHYLDEIAQVRDFLRAIRVNEEGGIGIPDDYEFQFVPGQAFQYQEAIEHHNRMIALCGLAQFLNLGMGEGGGSYALSRTHGTFFLLSLRGIARYITDVMETVAFRRLVDLNWGPEAPVPDLECEIVTLDPIEVSQALAALVGGQLLIPGQDVRQILRSMWHLPPEPEVEVEVGARESSEDEMYRRLTEAALDPRTDHESKLRLLQAAGYIKSEFYQHDRMLAEVRGHIESKVDHDLHVAAAHDPRGIPTGQTGRFWRPLTAKEAKSDIEEIADRWEKFDRELLRRVQAILDPQVAAFIERLRPLIQQRSIGDIAQLLIGGEKDLMVAFDEVGRAASEWARTQTVRNLGIQDPGADVRAARLVGVELQLVVPRLRQVLSGVLTRKLLTNTGLQQEMADGQVRRETVDAAVRESRRLYQDWAEKALPQFTEPQVGRAVREGREAVLQSPRVIKAERTEILDSRTCENCRRYDGLVLAVNDPIFATVKPPSGCLGGGRCRGTLLFYLDDEPGVPEDGEPPSKSELEPTALRDRDRDRDAMDVGLTDA